MYSYLPNHRKRPNIKHLTYANKITSPKHHPNIILLAFPCCPLNKKAATATFTLNNRKQTSETGLSMHCVGAFQFMQPTIQSNVLIYFLRDEFVDISGRSYREYFFRPGLTMACILVYDESAMLNVVVC